MTVERDRAQESGAAGLRRSIGVGQGVALYTSAILGAGVLILPGQAAAMAGPASILAWAFSCLLGIPLAFTFALLVGEVGDAGGVATYVRLAFGSTAGGVVGWLYFVAGAVGQTVVPLTGGYYLAHAMGLPGVWAYVFGAAILLIAYAANMQGMKLSGRLQIILAAAVAVVLLAAIVLAIPAIRWSAFTPFAPHGIEGVGSAAVLLFFAFAGWEAIAHLAEEFHDAKRGVWLSTVITIGVVSVLYVGASISVIGTRTYGDAQTNRLSIGLIVHDRLGFSAAVATAVVALIICLGTTNAFIAGISRLGYALAREGWLPRPVARLGRNDQPRMAITAVTAVGGAGIFVGYLFGYGAETIVVIPSTLCVYVYLVAMAAAIAILPGRTKWLPIVGLILTAVAIPFTFVHVWIPVTVAVVALVVRRLSRHSETLTTGT